MSVWVYVHYMHIGVCGDQKKALDPLESEL